MDDPYSMWVVNGCGTNDANGIYLECSNPSYSNTKGYICNPNLVMSNHSRVFYKISENGTIITKEKIFTTYSDILDNEDWCCDYFGDEVDNEETEQEKPTTLNELIETLTEEECQIIRSHHGYDESDESDNEQTDNSSLNITQFMKKYNVTKWNIDYIRKYIKYRKSYKAVLYTKNTFSDIWECVNGDTPAPTMVKKVSNETMTCFDENTNDKLCLTDAINPNFDILNFNCNEKEDNNFKAFAVVFCDFVSDLALDIYNISTVPASVSYTILDYLHCNHTNIGMVRIYEETKNHFAIHVRWMVFVCHICYKQWSAPKMTHWYERRGYSSFPCTQLMKYVKIKYPPQHPSRRGYLGQNVAKKFGWKWECGECISNIPVLLKNCDDYCQNCVNDPNEYKLWKYHSD